MLDDRFQVTDVGLEVEMCFFISSQTFLKSFRICPSWWKKSVLGFKGKAGVTMMACPE